MAAAVHDRMPVILPHAAYEAWLDPEIEDVSALQKLLCPYSAAEMTAYPVNPIVNMAGNEGPECIAAVTLARIPTWNRAAVMTTAVDLSVGILKRRQLLLAL